MLRVRLAGAAGTTRAVMRAYSTAKPAPKIAVESMTPAGTDLGLSIRKKGDPVVALANEEYPEWLWTVLDKKQHGPETEEFARKTKREGSKKAIKAANFLKSMNK